MMERRKEDCELSDLKVEIAVLKQRVLDSDRALVIANTILEKWQVASNEWRQENIDQRSQYMTSDKGQAMMSAEASLRYALEARVSIIEQARQLEIGKHSAFDTTWAIVVTVITILISGTALLIHFK